MSIFQAVAAASLAGGLMTAMAAGPSMADPPGVRIDHAAARVVVIAEPRSDYAITIDQGHAGLKPLQIVRDGGVTVVDGGYGGPTHWNVWAFGGFGLNCRGPSEHERVSIPGRGEVAVADLPLVTIHAPLDAHIGAGQAVFGEVRGARSLSLGDSGCGDWRIGDVHGPVHLALSGSGDVHGGNVGDAHISISGSGDVTLAAVGGALESHTSGSGDIRIESVSGSIQTKIAGSGDVTVLGGHAPDVGVAIAGSGDLKFGGVAGAVSASIAGSGDVQIARVTGPISKHVAGSGDVVIGK
jgi:hypothetical protein